MVACRSATIWFLVTVCKNCWYQPYFFSFFYNFFCIVFLFHGREKNSFPCEFNQCFVINLYILASFFHWNIVFIKKPCDRFPCINNLCSRKRTKCADQCGFYANVVRMTLKTEWSVRVCVESIICEVYPKLFNCFRFQLRKNKKNYKCHWEIENGAKIISGIK